MSTRIFPNNPEFLGLVDLRINIPYACPDGDQLSLQLVKPRWSSGGAGFPLVVFIQGSAWQKPDQFGQIPQLAQLARRGFVVASVTHRSCWQAPAPAFLKDVKAAIRFLRAHAADYDIDKTRVGAWGTSSGGNTALLLGLTGDDPAFATADFAEESSAVKAVVDCFGPTDLVRMATTRFDTASEQDRALFLALGGGEDAWQEKLALISPIRYVKPGLTLPPFLLLHGDADPVVDYEDSESFYHALTECGYAADLVRVTNATHEACFWSQDVLSVIFDFMEAHL